MTEHRAAVIASAVVIILSIYEFIAIVTDWVPTITDIIEAGPQILEFIVIGGLIAWLIDHFGWVELTQPVRDWWQGRKQNGDELAA